MRFVTIPRALLSHPPPPIGHSYVKPDSEIAAPREGRIRGDQRFRVFRARRELQVPYKYVQIHARGFARPRPPRRNATK